MSNKLDLLFQRLSDGDVEAFKLLFKEWYDPLFNTALAYVKIPELASDVCQQVFLRIWERRTILKNVEDAKSWLYTTARYQAFNVLKQEAKRESHEEMIRLKMEEPEQSPLDRLIHTQTQDLIKESMFRLTEKQRQAYILNRYEGLSFRQIAEQWGVSTDTIKEHVAKAIKEIKLYLSRHKDDLILIILNFLPVFF